MIDEITLTVPKRTKNGRQTVVLRERDLTEFASATTQKRCTVVLRIAGVRLQVVVDGRKRSVR